MFEYFMRKDFSISPLPARVEWPGNSLNPSRGQLNKHKQVHISHIRRQSFCLLEERQRRADAK